MKRTLFITIICTFITLGISAQNNSIRYEIEELVGTNSLRIGGREMKRGDKFYDTDKIEWTNKKQAIKVSEVKSTGKGTFSLDPKSMGRTSSVKEFLERRSNGSHRSSGELVKATNDDFPQKRIAFVVGNSYYDYDRSLANAALDAEYVTEALQDKGFDVILELNGSRAEFDADFEWFLKLANSYGENCVALFYYAGHGVQLEEKDFLVPCDARQSTTAQSKVECIEINDIVKQLQSNSRVQNLIIVDACRNKKGRGSEYDFMAPATDDGTNVLYSTKSGDWASDGSGSHSPFAEAFVNNIQREGYTWGQIAENIIYEVKDQINQTGLPFGIANRNFIFSPITNKTSSDNTFNIDSLENITGKLSNNIALNWTISETNDSRTQSVHFNELGELVEFLNTEYDVTSITSISNKSVNSEDQDAQYNLGMKYYEGDGVAKNYIMAFQYLMPLAKAGYTKAYFPIADMYHRGNGVSKDRNAAENWYKKAAAAGDEEAKRILINSF